MIRHSCFDGQVTFVMGGIYSLKRELVIKDMLALYPNYFDDMDGDLRGSLNLFMQGFSTTIEVEFRLTEDSHPALHLFQTWWNESQQSIDYKALFVRFLSMVDADIYDAWWDAYRKAEPTRLLAPPEVRTGDETKLDPEAEAAGELISGG